MEEVGATEALLTSIKTRADGSITLTLDINPNEIQIINKLMALYLSDNKLFTVAFVQSNKNIETT